MKNNKLLKVLETEILLYISKNSEVKNVRSFIMRVFGYLRGNLKLLKQPEYKKLYEECLIFINWSNKKDLKCKNTPNELNEIIADIMREHHNVQADIETVEKYLKFRIDAWNSGYYDKLFE